VAAQELRATINGLRGNGHGGDAEKQQVASKKIIPAPNAEPTSSGGWPLVLGAAQPFEHGQSVSTSPRQGNVAPPNVVGPLALQTLHQTIAQPPLQHFVHGIPQLSFFREPVPRATVPLAFGVQARAGLPARVAPTNMVGTFVATLGPAAMPPVGAAHVRLFSPRGCTRDAAPVRAARPQEGPGGPWSSRSTFPGLAPACNVPACAGPASARLASARMDPDPQSQYAASVQTTPQRATSPLLRPALAQLSGSRQLSNLHMTAP